MEAERIHRLIQAGKYVYSRHAERERQADAIPVATLEAALLRCEVIEEYPTDPRGPSCLVLGFAGPRPIHAVCAVKESPEELLLIHHSVRSVPAACAMDG